MFLEVYALDWNTALHWSDLVLESNPGNIESQLDWEPGSLGV